MEVDIEEWGNGETWKDRYYPVGVNMGIQDMFLTVGEKTLILDGSDFL